MSALQSAVSLAPRPPPPQLTANTCSPRRSDMAEVLERKRRELVTAALLSKPCGAPEFSVLTAHHTHVHIRRSSSSTLPPVRSQLSPTTWPHMTSALTTQPSPGPTHKDPAHIGFVSDCSPQRSGPQTAACVLPESYVTSSGI